MTQRRLILVTGTPRSGTTPIGDALAVAAGTRTLYEPLNFHVGDRRVRRYFEVPGAGGFTPERLDELVTAIRALRLRLRPGVFPDDRGLRRAAKRLTGSRTRMTYRRCRLDPWLRTIVWKDPFAAFLVEDVAGRHGVPVVATVRPPLAVAASFQRLHWGFDVTGLAERLVTADGTDVVHDLDTSRPAGNAAALWVLVNRSLLDVARRHDHVTLLDLERFVQDRRGALHDLYDRLGLPWSQRVERYLARTRGGQTAQPASTRAHVSGRDPSSVNAYWSEVLDDDDVRMVRAATSDLWGELQTFMRP